MARDTLSPDVHLANAAPLAFNGKLGNVYGPGGGFNHSPLGGGWETDLVDATADQAAAAIAGLQAAAAATLPTAADLGVSSLGGDTGGGGGDGGGVGDGPAGDSGDAGDGDGGGGAGDGGSGSD